MTRSARRSSRVTAASLWRLSVADARKRPARVVVTVVMIALGAGALTVALVMGATMRTALHNGLQVEYAGVDVVDNAGFSTAADSVGTGAGSDQGITNDDVGRISKLPGVRALGTVYSTVAVAQAGDATRGVTLETLNTNTAMRWERWSRGRAPARTDEIGLTMYTLRHLGIRMGDDVAIGRPNAGTSVFRVVGVVDVRGSIDHQNSGFGIVSTATAARLSGLAAPNKVMVALSPGADPAHVVNEINSVAPTGLPQTTRDILNADTSVAMAQINTMGSVVAGLAAISCLVAAITSATTAGASLSTRRRSWALLRCVGASGGHVAALVGAESVLLGLVGGAVGALAGLGLARAALPLVGLVPGLPSLDSSSFTIEPSSLVLPMLVALLLAAAASVVPAWLAARIPPSAALSATRAPAKRPSRSATIVVRAVALGGIALAAFGADQGAMLLAALGAILALIGFTATMPTLLVAGAAMAARRTRSMETRLGLLDVVRRPRAATIEAVAVVLAVAMIALSWVALSSVQASTSARLSATDSADLVVGGVTGAPIADETVRRLSAIAGVAHALPLRFGQGIKLVGHGVDGHATIATGTAGATAADLNLALPKGSPVSVVRDDTLYLPATPFPPFFEHGPVRLLGPNGRIKLRKVQYVEGLQVPSLVSPAVLARASRGLPVQEVWLSLKPDADRSAVLDRATALAITGGELEIGGPTVLDVRAAGVFTTARSAAVAILAIAVLVAVIGAAATAALSITERSREHATLRALGLDRNRLGRMLLSRILYVAAAGCALGVVVGTSFGLLTARLVTAQLSLEPRSVIPVVPILVLVTTTVLAIRVAALLPIERASYIPPSRALARA